MKKVLFIGGGSIGHIAPAIAVAQELKKHGHIYCHFVCGTRPNESAFIKKYHFSYSMLPHCCRRPLRTLIQSYRILSLQKPDLIFSKGTYVSVPLCLMAWLKKIPIILHESDIVMGQANRLLRMLAVHVFFGQSNPVREEVTKGSRSKGLQITGFSGEKPVLLVLGGSQGAKALNEIIWKHLKQLLEFVDVVHITGTGKLKTQDPKIKAHSSYWSTEFAHEFLPHLYALTDIALSRAGANAIAELEANQIPTILVPLRGVGHDHQYHNAVHMAKTNLLFVHVEQEELEGRLIEIIRKLIVPLRDTPPCHGEERSVSNHHGGAPQGDTMNATLKITKIILRHLE